MTAYRPVPAAASVAVRSVPYPTDADQEQSIPGRDSRLSSYPWRSGSYVQSPGTSTTRVTARSFYNSYTRPLNARLGLQSAEDAAWTVWFQGVNGVNNVSGSAYAGSEAGTGTLWSCGYESGDLRDQGVWPYGGYIPGTGVNGEAEVTKEAARTGSYGARLRIGGGVGIARAQLNRSLDAQGNAFTYNVDREYVTWMRINDLVARNRVGDSPNWWNVWQLITPGQAVFSIQPVLRNGDTQYAFQCVDKTTGSAVVIGESQRFSAGDWVKVRARWKPHISSGTFSIYLNEVLFASKTGQTRDSTDQPDVNRFEFGPYSDNLPSGEYSIDYDDVSISLVSGGTTVTPTAFATVQPSIIQQKTAKTSVPGTAITATLDTLPIDGDTTSIVAFLAVAGTVTLGSAPANWILRNSSVHDGITSAIYYQRMITFGGPYTGLGTFPATWSGGTANAAVILTHLRGAYNNNAHFDDTDRQSRLNPASGTTRDIRGRAPQRSTSGKTLELCFLAQLGDSIVDTPGRDVAGTLLPHAEAAPAVAPAASQPPVLFNLETPAPGEPVGWYYSSTDAQWIPFGWVGNAGPATYHAAVLADSPLLLLTLDETSGTVATDLANGRNGTYVHSPTLGVTGAGTATTRAVTFAAASSQYITVANSTPLNTGDTFTIECWLKTTNSAANMTVLSNGTSGGIDGFGFEITNAGNFRLTQVFVGVICTSTATINDGAWHHIAATKTGSTVKLYKDGADVSGAVTNHTIANSGEAFSVGTYFDTGTPGGQYLSASVDEVAYYSTALSATRIAAHYAAKDIATSAGVQMDTWGTAAPASGYHIVGERVWNSAPAAGGTMGWVSTVAGTPGTWKTFGAISA